MAKKNNQVISVSGTEVTVHRINKADYISLTDMAKHRSNRPALVIANWIRNKDTVEFLGLWESMFNPDFKLFEFEEFKKDAGSNSFALSPQDWIEKTNAAGIISKSGRYGGTYAHRDIAFEFGSYISPAFKLLLINDYQRLKEEEYARHKIQWNYQRFFTKVNYRLHTDVIRDYILPKLQTPKNREWMVYADEADLLNMAVFGMTARQWRDENPDKAKKGNIRDHADILQLNVLANLESLNSVMIEKGASKEKRFELLSQTAISQYKRLVEHRDLGLLGDGDEE